MSHDLSSLILAGLTGTLLMDLTGHVLSLAGIYKSAPNPAMLGRWAGHNARGRFRHDDFTKAAAIGNEASIGFLLHYGIGIVLAVFYGLLIGAGMLENTFFAAAGYGFATNVFPWFWLFPSLGLGVFGLKGNRLLLSSTVNHLVYGIGLYLVLA